MASRYCALAGPLWFSIIILLMVLKWNSFGAQDADAAPAFRENRLRDGRIAGWLLAGVLVFLAAGSALAIRGAKELASNLANARLFVLSIKSVPNPGTREEPVVILPDARTLADTYPGFLENRVIFAIFRNPRTVADRYLLLQRHYLSLLRE